MRDGQSMADTESLLLNEFLRQAAFYRHHQLFQAEERDYKIRLAGRLAEARASVLQDPAEGVRRVEAALRTKDNNFIDWRDMAPLASAFQRDREGVAAHLIRLWEPAAADEGTVRSFTTFLRDIGILGRGAQLTIASTLLMALSPYEFPPVRTRAFRAAFDATGYKPFDPATTQPHAGAMLWGSSTRRWTAD